MIFVNPDARSNKNIPNMALAYAATHYGVRVIDLNTMPEPAGRYLEKEAAILGISLQSRTVSAAREITEQYKRRYPASKIVSISGFLDVQCCYPYLNLPEKLEYSEPFSDKYPFPDYELFDSFPVFSRNWKKGEWAYAIMTSQGCPYQCVYCASRNRVWHPRSPENCYEELKRARALYGIRYFTVLDDCFNVDPKRVISFCELIHPLGLRWLCTNGLRADRCNEEMLAAMASSGLTQISFGIESVDDSILSAIHKGETMSQIETTVDIAARFIPRDRINGFFIIGLPGATYDKDMASIAWAKGKGIHAHFSYFVPSSHLSLESDRLFYGHDARPVSSSYDPALQEKVMAVAQALWSTARPPSFFSRVAARLTKVRGKY